MFSIENLWIILPVFLFSVGLHEAVHAYVAHWLGDPTAHDLGRVTLNPLKHIDILTTVILPIGLILMGLPPIFIAKPVPFRPDLVKYEEFGAALVGISGPFTNLGLAIVGAILLRVLPMTALSAKVLLIFMAVNVSLFIFNMIPFPPLDGSRLLYAFAPEPLQKLMYQIESMGFLAIMLFFFLLVPFLGPLLTNSYDFVMRLLLGGLFPV